MVANAAATSADVVNVNDDNHSNEAKDDDDDDHDEEEVWSALQSLQTRHEVHEIPFFRRRRPRRRRLNDQHDGDNDDDDSSVTTLRLWSLKESDLTPLDVIYNEDGTNDEKETEEGVNASAPNNNNNNDNTIANTTPSYIHYYDGTGTLLWLAAQCWCQLMAARVPELMKYLEQQSQPPPAALHGDLTSLSSSPVVVTQHRVCELGCGTGAAGIAFLLFLGRNDQNDDDDDDQTDCDEDENEGGVLQPTTPTPTTPNHKGQKMQLLLSQPPNYHILFTDSDADSLEWCRKNCQLNGLEPSQYDHAVLSWGRQLPQSHQPEWSSSSSSTDIAVIQPHSFETVLATDVVYDLRMIRPLFQTAEQLLVVKSVNNDGRGRKGGRLILTHVPRFCLPKEDRDEDVDDMSNNGDAPTPVAAAVPTTTTSSTNNYLDLERHIVEEAAQCGLRIVDQLRPHQLLKNLLRFETNHTGDDRRNDDASPQLLSLKEIQEAHAVVLVFERDGGS